MPPKNSKNSLYIYSFLLVPCIFYFLTVSPTIGMGDSAILTRQMVRMELSSGVNNHNLAVMIGHLFTKLPFGTLAYRANLCSAFMGSLSVYLFFLLIRKVTGNIAVAVFSALIMMVSHSLWWHSTIAENYAVNAFISLLIIHCYVNYEQTGKMQWLYRACFYSGFGLFNHVQMGFWLFATAAFILCRYRTIPRHWHRYFGYTILGILPYCTLLILDSAVVGSFSKAFSSASGGQFKSVMFQMNLWPDVKDLARLFLIQWPTPFLLCIPLGILIIIRKREAKAVNTALCIGFLINTLFFMQYHTWDKFAFLLQSFLILGFWGACGLSWIYDRANQSAARLGGIIFLCIVSIIAPIYIYGDMRDISDRLGGWLFPWNTSLTGNLYDSSEFQADPMKRDWRGVENFVLKLFSRLPPGSVYIDDDGRTYYQIADYFKRFYKLRPDIDVMLYNSWGMTAEEWGEGLDNTTAVYAVLDALHKGRRIFIPNLNTPYHLLVGKLNLWGIQVKKFPLDDTRWVYELSKY